MKIGQDIVFSLIFEIVIPACRESFRFRIIRKMPDEAGMTAFV